MSKNKPASTGLKIGMVARLSGVAAPTIRMWERRYAALTPARTAAGGRLYSRADTTRLALLKQLVERGHSIGTIAGLSDAKLQQMLAVAGAGVQVHVGQCRLAAVGGVLPEHLATAAKTAPQVRWIGAFHDLRELGQSVSADALDVVIVEAPTLRPAQISALLEVLQDMRLRLLIVVYKFTAQRDLLQLDRERALLLRAPVDATQLLRIALLSVNLAQPPTGADDPNWPMRQAVPPRRYSDSDLARLADGSTVIRCECPRHLSDLLMSLTAFERYSAECENLNQQDALVHHQLRQLSGHARALVEQGMRHVIEFEGLLIEKA